MAGDWQEIGAAGRKTGISYGAGEDKIVFRSGRNSRCVTITGRVFQRVMAAEATRAFVGLRDRRSAIAADRRIGGGRRQETRLRRRNESFSCVPRHGKKSFTTRVKWIDPMDDLRWLEVELDFCFSLSNGTSGETST